MAKKILLTMWYKEIKALYALILFAVKKRLQETYSALRKSISSCILWADTQSQGNWAP